MAYVFANDIGGFQGAREREQGRFDVLARQAAADQERAIASANEADRFAFQAAARDAQLMEDRNRFQLQQALQERDREERRGDVLFNRRLMLGQEGREQDRFKLAKERFETEKKLAEDDARLMGLEDESIGASIAGSLAAAEESLSAQQAALKRAQDALTQSKGKLAAAGFTFRGDNFVRPNLDPLLPEAEKKKLAEARAALEQNYFDAVAAKADADREFRIALKNASEVRTSAIRNQMFPGQGVVTSGRTGKKYSFGPQMGGPAASGGAMPSNVTDIPRDPSTGRLVVPGATPPPAARQTDEEFGPPAPVSPIVARQSATQVPPAAAAAAAERPRQYTGFVPAAYRAAGAGLKGAANYGIVLPIRTAVQSLPRMSGALIDAARATGDFLVMPPEGSDEYLIMMARRALEDRNRQRITQAFDEFAPRYVR